MHVAHVLQRHPCTESRRDSLDHSVSSRVPVQPLDPKDLPKHSPLPRQWQS